MGDAPLLLTEADSNVTWAAFPGDAGAPVILSGARLLSSLAWEPATVPSGAAGVLRAPVAVSDARRDAWFASHPGWEGVKAGPPPLVNSLFVGGTRAVRARYPNGNPQDETGICFSATQRPGEGCASYSTCATGSMGTQPAPAAAFTRNGNYPSRGDSPTWGCPQCGGGGLFKDSVYPFPPDHPVYSEPLPGIGFGNLSLYSFWASPFSRPSGVLVSPACDAHWANYSVKGGAADGVVHMFHGGLWGGWQYALNNVSGAPTGASHGASGVARADNAPEFTAEAPRAFGAPPSALPVPGAALWLRAEDASTAGEGGRVARWTDASGSGNHAAQATVAAQPTYGSSCLGGLPCVNLSGAQWLSGDALALPAGSTIFAVMQDAGSTTDYGSGVFMARGSEVGLGSRSATAAHADDDDAARPGSPISVMMLDWSGSPADPGHRDVRARPSLLTAVFAGGTALGFVDGCQELAAGFPGDGGSGGFDVGSRNHEMGRFLTGAIGEIIVYPTPLAAADRARVNAYLAARWGTHTPKHCGHPGGDVIAMSFGYGGYQEARGSGINPGQHFYLEGVLEELDAPGEWHYDLQAQMLYLLPNGTLGQQDVALPLVNSVMVVNGSQSAPSAYARNITFLGLTITQTRTTFLEAYEVPSGGDWSIFRGGALFVQDAEGVRVVNCTFNQPGGNAIMLSNHVVDSAVTDVECVFTGDSCVALLGSSEGMDGSAPTYPNHVTLSRIHAHEWGVFGKQSSCVIVSRTANVSILDSVGHNGPRACINENDSFGGGLLLKGNLLFNSVRETGDHGPFNSWDRQPYLTMSGVPDGFNDPAGRSVIHAVDLNVNNLIINGYNGVWTLDHDDDSFMMHDYNSFMIWGGCKNFLGSRKNCSGNTILYPGLSGRSAGNRRCQTDDNGEFAEQYHLGNTCTAADGSFYSWSKCTPASVNTTTYHTAGNSLLLDAGATFSTTCGASSFAEWQALGQDVSSTLTTTPSVQKLILMGAEALGLNPNT